jgi:hypothetical protein
MLELTPGFVRDGFAVDRHDHLFPREGGCGLSPQVSLRLLAFGESPRGHVVFFIMVHSLSLCLMGYAWFG